MTDSPAAKAIQEALETFTWEPEIGQSFAFTMPYQNRLVSGGVLVPPNELADLNPVYLKKIKAMLPQLDEQAASAILLEDPEIEDDLILQDLIISDDGTFTLGYLGRDEDGELLYIYANYNQDFKLDPEFEYDYY